MSVWARLGSFLLVLLGTFGTAYAVGEKLPGHTHIHGPARLALASPTDGAYRLVVDDLAGADSGPGTSTFHLEHHGMPVTSFALVHAALLHVVIVRPDLTGFQHVHPDIAANGRFNVVFDQPGPWHVVFESTPKGASAAVIVATDIPGSAAASSALPQALDDVSTHGLRIVRSGLTFSVSTAGGQPVEGLEPYLGQAAHLVAIRTGDLAYVHLHPTMNMVSAFMFANSLPKPGVYRVFLQFGYQGEVLTVPFTVVQP
ncbi:MAG: hypothetical protein WCI22_04775 [Actinomycetota bacterium]